MIALRLLLILRRPLFYAARYFNIYACKLQLSDILRASIKYDLIILTFASRIIIPDELAENYARFISYLCWRYSFWISHFLHHRWWWELYWYITLSLLYMPWIRELLNIRNTLLLSFSMLLKYRLNQIESDALLSCCLHSTWFREWYEMMLLLIFDGESVVASWS